MFKNTPTASLLTLCILALLLSFVSCTTSQTAKSEDESLESLDLTERLYRLNGVRVEGQGEDAIVQVRGGKANETPRYMRAIFMVNGQVLNYNYQTIYQMMEQREIVDIRVLRNAQAATFNAGSGQSVISITTKGKY